MCVQTIAFDIRGYFEISMFEISRADCVQGSKLSVANLPPENPICHLLKMWVAKSCYLGISYERNSFEEQAVFH